ncbi:MAG: hypothetical protein J7J72_02115 [Bacteroidales bacterium]|nr:hypothetical protein [Bacteroidales bacterium]
MKKLLILSFLLGFSISGFTQNLKVEYRYLCLVKTQPKQLIIDNLRNAEIMADSLMFSKSKPDNLSSLFFMELGNNYAAVHKPELAIYSFLRQRFCFPNDSISIFVEKQIKLNALYLDIDKQLIDYLIQKSAPYNISENTEANLNNLIYYVSKIETKVLTPILVHQIELMNSKGIPLLNYLLKWEELTQISIPLGDKMSFLNQDFNTLELSKKQFYYSYLTRYYLRNKAWKSAENSLSILKNLNKDKPSTFGYLHLRTKWHF